MPALRMPAPDIPGATARAFNFFSAASVANWLGAAVAVVLAVTAWQIERREPHAPST